MFKERLAIEHDTVIDKLNETTLPDFKDVFRKVMRKSSGVKRTYFVPANGAVEVIMRYGVEKDYNFNHPIGVNLDGYRAYIHIRLMVDKVIYRRMAKNEKVLDSPNYGLDMLKNLFNNINR